MTIHTKWFSLSHSVRKNGLHDFTLLVASVNKTESVVHEINAESMSIKLTVEYGDFSAALAKAVVALREVGPLVVDLHRQLSYLLYRLKNTQQTTPRQR